MRALPRGREPSRAPCSNADRSRTDPSLSPTRRWHRVGTQVLPEWTATSRARNRRHAGPVASPSPASLALDRLSTRSIHHSRPREEHDRQTTTHPSADPDAGSRQRELPKSARDLRPRPTSLQSCSGRRPQRQVGARHRHRGRPRQGRPQPTSSEPRQLLPARGLHAAKPGAGPRHVLPQGRRTAPTRADIAALRGAPSVVLPFNQASLQTRQGSSHEAAYGRRCAAEMLGNGRVVDIAEVPQGDGHSLPPRQTRERTGKDNPFYGSRLLRRRKVCPRPAPYLFVQRTTEVDASAPAQELIGHGFHREGSRVLDIIETAARQPHVDRLH